MEGTVVTLKLDRGFGFLRPLGGTVTSDIFFHCTSLHPSLAFDETLQERLVRYEVVDAARGRRAIRVAPLEGKS